MTSTPAVLGGLLFLACSATGGALLGVCERETYKRIGQGRFGTLPQGWRRCLCTGLACTHFTVLNRCSQCTNTTAAAVEESPSLRSVFLSTKSVSSFVSRRRMILSWVRGAHRKSGNRRAGALTCIVGKREMCAPRLACVTYARRWQSLALFSCGDWKVVFGLFVCPLHLCTVETVTNQHTLHVCMHHDGKSHQCSLVNKSQYMGIIPFAENQIGVTTVSLNSPILQQTPRRGIFRFQGRVEPTACVS